MQSTLLLSDYAYRKLVALTKAYPKVENGGCLYGRVNPTKTFISDISDAGPNAHRTYGNILLDLEYLNKITAEMIEQDLFLLGTWHSHPSESPLSPSSTDIETMKMITTYFEKLFQPVFCITNVTNEHFNYRFFRIYQGVASTVPLRCIDIGSDDFGR